MNFYFDHFFAILGALGISGLVFALTSYRMSLVYRAFRIPISFRHALAAQTATVLGNMFWIPIIGGLIGQKKILSSVPPAAMASIHLCERTLVACVGGICALIGARFIWEQSWLSQTNLVFDFFHVAFAMCMIGLYVFRNTIPFFWRSVSFWRLTGVVAITSVIWLLSSLMFVCFLYPEHELATTIPYGLVVSFLSSLPITWNGWGVREASSVFIFRYLEVSTAEAIKIAVCCGLISMAVALLMGLRLRQSKQKIKWQVTDVPIALSWHDNQFLKAMGIACAFLIFFQIHVQGSEFKININAADPLAIGGLFLFGLHLFQNRKDSTSWGPILFMGSTILTLTLSALWGVIQFGGSWWGVVNKSLGLWIVWGYFGLGVMLARHQIELQPILEVMKKVIVCIVVYHFICLAVNQNFYHGNFLCSDLKGFAMNRNAFAMQALCTMLALMCCTQSHKSLVVTNVALYFTFSRTAHILTPIVYAFVWWMGILNRQQIQRILFLSVGWIVGINLVGPFMAYFAPSVLTTLFPSLYSGTYSDSERWYTIVQGFQMWQENIWMGAGLGAFVQSEWLHHQRYLMIHNSYIWILAEMGLIGASIWASFAGWIAYASWRLEGNRRFAALGICFILFAAAMVHEVVYQRIFWWMLGLLLGAQPNCLTLPQGVVNRIQNKAKKPTLLEA